MQKIHSCRRYVSINGDGACFEGFYIDYYILRSEIRVPNANFAAIMYGIEIEKKYEEEGTEKTLEQAVINDIYSSKEKAEALIKKLSSKFITPSMLKYVIDDMLGEDGYEPPKFTLSVI